MHSNKKSEIFELKYIFRILQQQNTIDQLHNNGFDKKNAHISKRDYYLRKKIWFPRNRDHSEQFRVCTIYFNDSIMRHYLTNSFLIFKMAPVAIYPHLNASTNQIVDK